MRRFSLSLVLIITMVFAFSVNAKDLSETPVSIRQAPMERAPGIFDAATYTKTMRALADWLRSEAAPLSLQSVITVNVTPEDIEGIENYTCETCNGDASETYKVRVGVVKDVGVMMEFANLNRRAVRKGQYGAGSVQDAGDGGFVWTAVAESPTAAAIRIHFTDVSLPANAALYVYNEDGRAFGPYTGTGPAGNGDFWSHTIFGSQAYVQLRFFGEPTEKDLENLNFNIAGIAHIGARFLMPMIQEPAIRGDVVDRTEEFCSFNEPCVVDVNCQSSSAVNTARDAVGHMQWVSGAWIYICSGGLIADNDPGTQIPYFLTANHCISKSKDAKSLEVFFLFDTSNCGGACYDPDGAVPSTLGSDVISTGRDSDFSLLQLWESAPSGTAFLGWTSAPVAFTDGAKLYRVSHPSGAPQAYSQHDVSTTAGTCSSLPRGNFIYSRDQVGATEGGSSGSPIVNGSGQIVGQLYGACGTNLDDVCDSVNNATVDGAFAATYPYVAQYLDNGGSGGSELHVDSIVLSTKQKGPKTDYIAKITIVDENGAPVEGAEVFGEFDGTPASGTTGSDGEATIKITVQGSTVTQFCVTNVVLSGYTYVPPATNCSNF